MPQRQLKQPPVEEVHSPSWESTPWAAQERIVEEPPRAAQPPLRLSDEHVVEPSLAGDSIRLAR